ncbi:hypothetical protein [Longimicrobium sp.]|uniref:hypothetical protein n=1 Tax=Longimicrobium sp. TaxID=2029185 RepID=UPI002E32A078|nr:hypothetical protein [Longimicrobium sp.]HEX6041195.1 hypothetical protein [Longimicrobium sp.]
MKGSILTRGVLAAATAVSLAFGAAQAFAAPVAADTREGICLWHECRAMCGTGCGGECIGNECYCDC